MRAREHGFAEIIVGLALVAMMFGVYALVLAWSCGERWKHSGMASRWGIGQGCLVQTPGGRWVPDDRVRDVDLTPQPQRPDEKKPEIPTKPMGLTT